MQNVCVYVQTYNVQFCCWFNVCEVLRPPDPNEMYVFDSEDSPCHLLGSTAFFQDNDWWRTSEESYDQGVSCVPAVCPVYHVAWDYHPMIRCYQKTCILSLKTPLMLAKPCVCATEIHGKSTDRGTYWGHFMSLCSWMKTASCTFDLESMWLRGIVM